MLTSNKVLWPDEVCFYELLKIIGVVTLPHQHGNLGTVVVPLVNIDGLPCFYKVALHK